MYISTVMCNALHFFTHYTQEISRNIRPTPNNYHLTENCISDEESITAPPYSPVSQSSSEEVELIYHSEGQERSMDSDNNRPHDDRNADTSYEVCSYTIP